MHFLHLSDLHYKSGQPFQIAILQALLKDLKERADQGFSADILVFSGDLAYDPDDSNIYYEFEHNFLEPILNVVGLTTKEVAFCPGNHDVSHNALREWTTERDQLQTAMAGDQNDFSAFLKTGPMRSYIKAISAGYFDLMERCGHPWREPTSHVYKFPDHKISLVALNSALGCGLEGSKYDRGKLAIPADDALAAFQAAGPPNQTLSLMHHTIGDLSEASSRLIVPIITNNATMHFFGHVHHPKPTAETSPGTSCFMVQGGALYDDMRIYNGYSMIFTGPIPDRVAARYRTYYPDRMTFDLGTNVAEAGTFYSSPAAKSYWDNLPPVASNDDICLWLLETADAVVKELDRTITNRSLSDTFVDPNLTRTRAVPSDDANEPNETRVTCDQILRSKQNTVIACDDEYGATSLLNYLTMQFHREGLSLDTAFVPSFIDGRKLRGSYSAAVASTIRGSLPESADPRFKLQPLHDAGRLVILVDNIEPGNTTQIGFITALRGQFPKARLIVAVKMPFANVQRLRPVIGIDNFDFIQVRTLTRGKS